MSVINGLQTTESILSLNVDLAPYERVSSNEEELRLEEPSECAASHSHQQPEHSFTAAQFDFHPAVKRKSETESRAL